MMRMRTSALAGTAIVFAFLCGAAFIGRPASGAGDASAAPTRSHSHADYVRPNLCDLRSSAELDRQFEAHCQKWSDFVQKKIRPPTTLADFDTAMEGAFRDRAEFFLGGSGAREVHYLIDDFVEIVVFVDLSRQVTGYDVEPRGLWMRGPEFSYVRIWPMTASFKSESSPDKGSAERPG
ncbi:MAG TPA: hypothetical protein PK093_10505 [Phycisphaerae bacterium]|nr:hypothetical protein [Phycisphaerae bacterium]